MKFMVIAKATKESEAGEMPSTEMLTAMGGWLNGAGIAEAQREILGLVGIRHHRLRPGLARGGDRRFAARAVVARPGARAGQLGCRDRPADARLDPPRPVTMRIHLINPSDVAFGVAVITPRWLYVLAGSTPRQYGDPHIVDETLEQLDFDAISLGRRRRHRHPHPQRAPRLRSRTRRAGARRHGDLRRHPHQPVPRRAVRSWRRARGGEGRWGSRLGPGDRRRAGRHAAACLRRRQDRWRGDARGPLGPAAPRTLHDGLGADGARLPEALLVLLGVAH